MKKIKFLSLLVTLVLVLGVSARAFATLVGTAGPGDECNVHAEDASHTCSEGLVCVPQNDNSEGNGKCASSLTPTPTLTPTVTPTPTTAPCDNEEEDCPTPTPSATPTPTVAPTETPSNPGGPGDGLGCATHDCSSHPQPQGQVLGASTSVLGLSSTSSSDAAQKEALLFLGAISMLTGGVVILRKNA